MIFLVQTNFSCQKSQLAMSVKFSSVMFVGFVYFPNWVLKDIYEATQMQKPRLSLNNLMKKISVKLAVKLFIISIIFVATNFNMSEKQFCATSAENYSKVTIVYGCT